MVYQKIIEKIRTIPIELIAEFIRLSEDIEWGGAFTFKQVLTSRAFEPVNTLKTKNRKWFGNLENSKINESTFSPVYATQDLKPIDPEVTANYLTQDGPFSQLFSAFEFRPQQISMLKATANALSQGNHLFVEAGTGTGKSLAYLVPAAEWATQNNARVVISTNTINLQEQLVKKDIPDMVRALGINVRASVLKGRANYLCPRRLEILRQRGVESQDEMRVLAKVLCWLWEDGTGDRSEINLNSPDERMTWVKLSADDEGCQGEICVTRFGGNCPFYQAKQNALSSHLVIVNHALLLSDVVSNNRVLPEYKHLIIDEAHHLEDATTSALSIRVTRYEIERLLHELGGTNSGNLGYLLGLLRKKTAPRIIDRFLQIIENLQDLMIQGSHNITGFFRDVEVFLSDQRENQSTLSYNQQERITPGIRTLPIWSKLEVSWEQTRDRLKGILSQLTLIHNLATESELFQIEEIADVLSTISFVQKQLLEYVTSIQSLISEPKTNEVYWIEFNPTSNVLALQLAPLHVGTLMEKHLWQEKTSIILTSATLTTNNQFDYLRSRLNAEHADELILDSPFDFEKSALVYLVNDMPEPSDINGFQRAIEHALLSLGKAAQGRMMALFTSYSQLKKTSQAISAPLANEGITVFEQGGGASANTLLEFFKETDKAVLLGTRSFWEGVDIPGDALSILVIVKLPFDVPSDPIVAARSETFDNPFKEYSLPEAILRFRQGFGRLIRTKTDRGVVVVLDKRILTKAYGKSFLDSLPKCRTQIGRLNESTSAIRRWLQIK